MQLVLVTNIFKSLFVLGVVLYVFRDPNRGGTSVEEIYHGIISELREPMNIQLYYYNDKLSLLQNVYAIYKLKPNIIHVTSDIYFIIPFFIRAKKIITIHDIGRYKELKGIKKFIYKWVWLKVPSKFADKIITVSDYTREDVLTHVNTNLSKKIIRIYNPVPKIFKKHPKESNENIPTILQVGTNPNKNLENVISALSDVPCLLQIIGRLSTKQMQLLQSNKINFSNHFKLNYDEVYRLYVRCDVVLFISLQEGFGMPIIEANAIGRPVICSTSTSLPEIAKDAALFVEDATSVSEISSKIVLLLKDKALQETLINNGYQNAKRFDLAAIAGKYLEVYRSLDRGVIKQ